MKKISHLKTQVDFQEAFSGRFLGKTQFFTLHRSTEVSTDSEPALGMVLPKKRAKRAVTRNLIRRQIDVAFREVHSQLKPGKHVVRLRETVLRQQFPSASSSALKKLVRQELEKLLGSMKAENSASS